MDRGLARVIIARDDARRAVAALLEWVGFRVETFLTAEGAVSDDRSRPVDLVVAMDQLPGARGEVALEAAKAVVLGDRRTGAGDRQTDAGVTRTVLLVQGASGFAPQWGDSAGVDFVMAVRADPVDWLPRLLRQFYEWWPGSGPTEADLDEAAGSTAGTILLPEGFDLVAKHLVEGRVANPQACLRVLMAAFTPERLLPVLTQLIVAERSPFGEAVFRAAVDVAIDLRGAGFEILAMVAESTTAPSADRARAIDALVRYAPPASASAIVGRLVADRVVAAEAAEAMLVLAEARGVDGLTSLVSIAESSALEPMTRARAVAAVWRLFPRTLVRDTVARWAESDDPVLRTTEWVPDDALSEVADRRRRADGRVRTLAKVAADTSHDPLVALLAKLLEDRSQAVRAAAVEWSVRRPDVDSELVWPLLSSSAPLQRAALLGAQLAGRSGFSTLARLAREGTDDVRQDALRLLALRFDSGRVGQVVQTVLLEADARFADAAIDAAVLLGRPGHGALRLAAAKAKVPDTRCKALDALVAHAAPSVRDAALWRALSDRQATLQQVAVAHAVCLLDERLPELLDKIAESHRFDLAEAALNGLTAAGPGGYAGLATIAAHEDWPAPIRRRAAEAIGRAPSVPATHEATKPVAPPWSGPTEPAEATGRRAPSDPQAVAVSPRRVRHRAAPRMLPIERAQEALSTALRQGRSGFRALRSLAESPRVPVEVRAQALRHLAAGFPDRDVRSILESGLASGEPELQTAALGAIMIRDDARRRPVSALVGDRSVSPGLRMRAARFLAHRWPKRQVQSDLEGILDDDHSGLRRVALEGLFPSMQYTPEDEVETRLINVLEVHEDPDVRASAARALGAFGGAAAERALGAADSWRIDGALRTAVRESLLRLRKRRQRDREVPIG